MVSLIYQKDTNKLKTLEDVKDVLIYLRRSQGDDLNILEKHEMEAIRVCEQNGWSYIIKKEIGSGDSIDDRPVMVEVLELVEEGRFDAVVVSYFDRLGRGSGKDQDRVVESFLIGDTLIIELFPFNVYNMEDEASEEQVAFKQFLARRDLKNINKRLTVGKNSALRMGRWVFGTKPYGYVYHRKDKKLVPDKETSIVLKSIFEMYLTDEMSTVDIAWELNKSKIPSPTGSLWGHKTVNEILKNEVYTGVIVYNKTTLDKRAKKNPDKKTKKRIYLPKEKWITVSNTHDALVSKENFDKVQEIMKNRKTHNKGNGVNYLSGVVKCYSCGKTLPILKDLDGNDEIGKCRHCGECKGGQADLVMEAIMKTLEVIKEEMHRVNDSEMKMMERKELITEIEKAKEKLTINENALANIERAFENGMYDLDKAIAKTQERKEIIYELQDIIKRKTEQLDSFSVVSNKDRIKRIDEFFVGIMQNKEDKKLVNKLIKSIIDKVIWKRTLRDEVEVTVNFL